VDLSFVAAWLHRNFCDELLECIAWDQSASADLSARDFLVSDEIAHLRDAQTPVLCGLLRRNQTRELVKWHGSYLSPPLESGISTSGERLATAADSIIGAPAALAEFPAKCS
jgi:hypothetical protein